MIDAIGLGGTPGYTYLWSDGQIGTPSIGLAAGLYSVTATDLNGCTTSSSTTIQYIFLGVLKIDYAVALTMFSMVAAGLLCLAVHCRMCRIVARMLMMQLILTGFD